MQIKSGIIVLLFYLLQTRPSVKVSRDAATQLSSPASVTSKNNNDERPREH